MQVARAIGCWLVQLDVLTKCITNCKLDMKFIDHALGRFEERLFTPEMAVKLISGKRLLTRSRSNPNRYNYGKIQSD